MKKISAILLLLSGVFMFGQGMSFHYESFNDLLAQAKKENKVIFLDAYASWCGPCKLMDKNVFTKEEVGNFYNANFINTRIDMEKGEGVGLAKKYGVRAYPTYLFINGDGEVVYRVTGYYEPDDFVNIGKEAADPSKQVAVLQKRFDAGEKDPEFLKNYMKVFAFSDPELATKAAVRYFDGKKGQELSQEDLGYLFSLTSDSTSPLYPVILEHKEQIEKLVPPAAFEGMLKNLKLNAVMKIAYNKESKKLDETKFLSEAEKIVAPEEAKELLNATKMNMAFKNKDYATYEKLALTYYGDGSNPKFSSNALNTVAWNFFEKIDNKESLKKAILWAEAGAKKAENYAISDTVANLYFKIGDKKNAKIWAEKAIELGKKEGEDTSTTEEILTKLK